MKRLVLRYSSQAIKELKYFPSDVSNRIMNKMDYYFESSMPLEYAEKLKDSRFGDYRFRVGRYRIYVDVGESNIVYVLAIEHRQGAYRKFHR